MWSWQAGESSGEAWSRQAGKPSEDAWSRQVGEPRYLQIQDHPKLGPCLSLFLVQPPMCAAQSFVP